MAEIYLCSVRGPEGFEKKVVVKRIRSLLAKDPDFVQMFIAEARLASLLNHPNIVQIFDFNKDEESYYLAMEYVRGQSLWSVHKRARELMFPIPTTLVAQIGAEVARGLHYAHRLSVKGEWLALVHRDVTPHNVLLSYDGAVKLTDFGIAKAGSGLSAPGKLKGKFAYMSPEQARGEAVDARSDIFSLGIVLWELLTGGRLFDGDGDLAILRSVQHSIIPPPARLNSEVPPGLDAAVMKALERNPVLRYQSAQELERALAEHVFAQAKGLEDTDTSAFLKHIFSDIQQASGGGIGSEAPGGSPATAGRGDGPRPAWTDPGDRQPLAWGVLAGDRDAGDFHSGAPAPSAAQELLCHRVVGWVAGTAECGGGGFAGGAFNRAIRHRGEHSRCRFLADPSPAAGRESPGLEPHRESEVPPGANRNAGAAGDSLGSRLHRRQESR